MIDQDEWMKIAQSDEPLDPVLAAWMEDTDFMGPVLKHPLVFQVPFHSNGLANHQLKWKKEGLATAMREKNWYSVIFLHERPYRLMAFMDIRDQLDDEAYWGLLSSIWTDSENVWQNVDEWREVLSSDRPGRLDFMMDEEEREVFDALPDVVDVWRGGSLEINEEGMSWTTDHQRATWFAKRWMSRGDRDGVVIHGRVRKENVVAYLNGRNEAEIVTFDTDVVEIIKYEVLEQPMTMETVGE